MSRYEFIYVCDKNWEQLEGDERERFCFACDLKVLNFDAISANEQAERLQSAAQNGERLCARAAVFGVDNLPCPGASDSPVKRRKPPMPILLGIIAPRKAPIADKKQKSTPE